MNSGLYALAGASATATAAACANLLLEPMTKVSKVYFGFSLVGVVRPVGLARDPMSRMVRQPGRSRAKGQRAVVHPEPLRCSAVGLAGRVACSVRVSAVPPPGSAARLVGGVAARGGRLGRAIGRRAERHPDAQGTRRGLRLVGRRQRGGDRRVDDDGKLDVAAELAGERVRDQDSQPVLQLVLRELVRGRDQGRVLY